MGKHFNLLKDDGVHTPKLFMTFYMVAFLLSLSSTCLVSFWKGSYSPLFTYPLFLTIISLTFRGEAKNYTRLYFFIAVFVSHCLLYSFSIDDGRVFIGGGDDELFYELAIKFSDGKFSRLDDSYIILSSKAYIHFLGSYVSFLRILNLDFGFYLFDLLMINSLAGALSVGIFFNAFKASLNRNDLKKIIYLLLLFPPLIYYSATLLREPYFILAVAIIIYALTKIRTRTLQISTIVIVLFIIAQFRMATAAFISIVPIVYYFLSIKSTVFRVIISFVTLGIFGYLLQSGVIQNQLEIERRFSEYDQLISTSTSTNSMGAALRNSTNPVLKIVSFFYTIFSPIPPPIMVDDFNFKNFLISMGAFVWYLILPAYFFSIFKLRDINEKLMKIRLAFLPSFVLSVIIINFSSGDQRHLIFLYPLIMTFATIYILQNKKFYLKFLLFYSIFACFCISGYIVLKFYA